MDICLVETARKNADNLIVSIDTANAERRLRNALIQLKKTRKKLTIAFGINVLKDAKKIYDTAAIECACYGQTAIYQGLAETLDIVEQHIGSISILLRGVEIRGLSNILAVLSDTDFDYISEINFGIPNVVNCIIKA